MEIRVDRVAAAPLDEDEYYVSDLVGLDVTVDGRSYGTIVSVIDASQAPLLEIRRNGTGERNGVFLVPFMGRYIGTVDLSARTLEVVEPWILG